MRTRAVLQFLLLLLGINFLLRVIFVVMYFRSIEFADLSLVFYWGLRLDFSAIFILNSLFLVYYLFLDPSFKPTISKRITYLLAIGLNVPLITLGILDVVYYKYNMRRLNVDVFTIAKDSFQANGFFLSYFWPFLVFFILLVSAFTFLTIKIFRVNAADNHKPRKNIRHFVAACMIILAGFAFSRGFGSRPLMPYTPLLYIDASYQPVVSNATLSILYSFLKSARVLKEVSFFSDDQVDAIHPIEKHYEIVDSNLNHKKNVVIFILESVEDGFIKEDHPQKCYTPFLDSILQESHFFENAYANGSQSNQGLVAILGGLAPFTELPYFYSTYAGNKLQAFPSILSGLGYSTHFFMGAEKDHFGFEKFGRIVGIENYYSRDTYGNDAHYDGNWGIYDHYFLTYAADELVKASKPFFATVFNISTHPPFEIPQFLIKNQRFVHGNKAQRSVSYLDYALELFFERIKKEPWYENTVFFFISDHTILPSDAGKNAVVEAFKIPFFIFEPGGKRKVSHFPVQQIDLVPTILHKTGFDEPFFALGNSVYDSVGNKFAFNRFGEIQQVIDSSFILGFNLELKTTVYLYNFKSDPECKDNLVSMPDYLPVRRRLQTFLSAFIQQSQNRLVRNRLNLERD